MGSFFVVLNASNSFTSPSPAPAAKPHLKQCEASPMPWQRQSARTTPYPFAKPSQGFRTHAHTAQLQRCVPEVSIPAL